MTLPNRYLVGDPEAGGTTFAGWLSEHPDVDWSVPKASYSWSSDYPRKRAYSGFDTRSAYEARYFSEPARSARYRGDGSTASLSSDRAIPDVCAAVPEARDESDVGRTRHRRLVPSVTADTDILSGILDA